MDYGCFQMDRILSVMITWWLRCISSQMMAWIPCNSSSLPFSSPGHQVAKQAGTGSSNHTIHLGLTLASLWRKAVQFLIKWTGGTAIPGALVVADTCLYLSLKLSILVQHSTVKCFLIPQEPFRWPRKSPMFQWQFHRAFYTFCTPHSARRSRVSARLQETSQTPVGLLTVGMEDKMVRAKERERERHPS